MSLPYLRLVLAVGGAADYRTRMFLHLLSEWQWQDGQMAKWGMEMLC